MLEWTNGEARLKGGIDYSTTCREDATKRVQVNHSSTVYPSTQQDTKMDANGKLTHTTK